MNNRLNKFMAGLAEYFNLSPYLVSQQEAEASIREGVSFKGPNIIILVLAIFIASLGLNTNSTAVIIGAMLISPLMGPIIGLGLGIGVQDFALLKRSLRNLLMATLFSIATSTIYFLISPVGQSHSELLARTSPTIYDVFIGFFGGAAGIMAIGARSKGNVIPGVAIATALMPPLCTVGYGLATWQMTYFFGALYLFIINSIYICVATFIGVKLMSYKPAPTIDPVRAKRVRHIVYAVAIVALIPSVYLTYMMLRQSRFEFNVETFVSEQCNFPDTHILATTTEWSASHPSITLTLIGKVLPPDSLKLALSSKLPLYHLQNATINIVQGSRVTSDSPMNEDTSITDIYRVSQMAMAEKQNTIDSLRAVINNMNKATRESSDLMPELKVIFPQIADIAISHTLLANADSTNLDTINVALIKTRSTLSNARRLELARYLQARLSLKRVEIVNLP